MLAVGLALRCQPTGSRADCAWGLPDQYSQIPWQPSSLIFLAMKFIAYLIACWDLCITKWPKVGQFSVGGNTDQPTHQISPNQSAFRLIPELENTFPVAGRRTLGHRGQALLEPQGGTRLSCRLRRLVACAQTGGLSGVANRFRWAMMCIQCHCMPCAGNSPRKRCDEPPLILLLIRLDEMVPGSCIAIFCCSMHV